LDCSYTLDNYGEGEFDNPDVKAFSERIAEKIHDYEQEGGRGAVREILVKGVADGLHNNGHRKWSEVPEKCRKVASGPLLDKGLDYSRGCLVREAMLESLEHAFFIKYIKPTDDPFDIPDGGARGPTVRRVEVHFRVAGVRK
jgi:hypothetical protein